MTGVPSGDLKGYFEEAKRWDQDRLAAAVRSKRLAWTVAGCAGVLALAAVGAVAALTPLKTVEPFVVRVDRATGAVDVMSGLKGTDQLTYDEAVNKYFLALYVRTREGWLPQAAEQGFRQVAIMSSPAEQERWADDFRPSNPQSPQVLWGQNATSLIDVRAISFVSPKVADVRFHRILRQAQETTESDWIATIAFTYTKAPMAEADRLRNPLGFQVVSYRSDPEVVR
jgi:type IV secretion system protein VirB8